MAKRKTAKQVAASRRNLAKARAARRRRNKRIVNGVLIGIGTASAAAQLSSYAAQKRGHRALYGKQRSKPSRRSQKQWAAHDAHLRKTRAAVFYNNGHVRSHRGPSRPLHAPKAITGRRTSSYV